jgi:hypothetical protein
VVWFALNEDRALFAFAGIWTKCNADRGTKSKPIPGPHQVYDFLTTSPNAMVEPIYPKAMPVILTTDEERVCGSHAPHIVRQRVRRQRGDMAAMINAALTACQILSSCFWCGGALCYSTPSPPCNETLRGAHVCLVPTAARERTIRDRRFGPRSGLVQRKVEFRSVRCASSKLPAIAALH